MHLRVTRAILDDGAQAEAVVELIDCYARDLMGGGGSIRPPRRVPR